MSQPDERVARIVNALIAQTKVGNIAWLTTDDEEKFLCSPGGNSSILIDTNERISPRPYWLTILNQRGREVEQVATNADPWKASLEIKQKLAELYILAKRSALQIDTVLDQVLSDLEGLPPF